MCNIELYNDDCCEALKNIKDSSIDVVLTDIPYGIDFSDWDVLHTNTNSALGKSSEHQRETTFKRRGKPINGWSKSDKEIPYQYENWCNIWAKELFRVTKEASPILIFSSRRFMHRVCCSLEDNGFMIRDILIWEKDKCNSKAQRIENVLKKRNCMEEKYINYRLGNLAPFYEPIIFAMKPYEKTLTDIVLKDNIGGFFCDNDKIPSNIFYCPTYRRNKYHETQKPVKLLEDIIKVFSISESHTILDFTMGSGSTGVACKNLNRNFIGIEKDNNYFKIAMERLNYIEGKK